MISNTGRIIAAHLFILLTAGLFMAGCGKKAPPRPPGIDAEPAAVGNLSKTISDDTLSLTWNLAAGGGGGPAGFYVFRSKTRLTDSYCPGCPVLFERVAAVRVSGGTALRPFEYREALERGYRYIYKVAAYSDSGWTGRDSNLIDFTY